MRRLVVAEFMTLDGVMEAPGFEEHRDGKNAWALRLQSEETQEFIREQSANADAFLMGRTTYQIWAAFWPTMPVDDAFTSQMNSLPKYVVSSTLKEVTWTNSHLLQGDVFAQIAALKAMPGRDILVAGSADLVAGLIEHDLVDEFQLLVFPIILGSGKHLFRDGIDIRALRLAATRAFSSGVVLLTYQPESELPTSEYVETYAWTNEQVRSFQAAQDTERVLATILFTDIVDSTARAPATASWPRSTRPPGRSAARSAWERCFPAWDSRSEWQSIPARSNGARRTWGASACTSPRGRSPKPPVERWSSPGPCGTLPPVLTSPSVRWGRLGCVAFRANGSCSRCPSGRPAEPSAGRSQLAAAGWMLWFRRKTLSGSYLRFSSASRVSWFTL
jgi:dihydrofolate reductase